MQVAIRPLVWPTRTLLIISAFCLRENLGNLGTSEASPFTAGGADFKVLGRVS